MKGDAIHKEFAPARCLPHILDVPRFCQRIGRYITSHHGPGGVRSGTSASWSENAGFTLFPPAGGWGAGRQVPRHALWGDLYPLSTVEFDSLVDFDMASGRTIVSASCRCNLADDSHLLSCSRQHYLLLGTNSIINCMCAAHANLHAHEDPHFNTRRPYYGTLDPGDWVACCTRNDGCRISGEEELGLNYGSTYWLSCPLCTGLILPLDAGVAPWGISNCLPLRRHGFGDASLLPARWKLLFPPPLTLVAQAPLHQHLHRLARLSLLPQGLPLVLVGRWASPPLLVAFPLPPWARHGQNRYALLLCRLFLPLRRPPPHGLSVRSARLWGHLGWGAPSPL